MRKGKLLLIAAVVVFVLGAGSAVFGSSVSRSADDDLATAEADRDDAEDRLDDVEGEADAAVEELEGAQDRSGASLTAAREAVDVAEELCGCDERLADLSEQERQAILEGRFQRFNDVNAELSVWLADSNNALQQLRTLLDSIEPVG